jgi:hypothetical protein
MRLNDNEPHLGPWQRFCHWTDNPWHTAPLILAMGLATTWMAWRWVPEAWAMGPAILVVGLGIVIYETLTGRSL